MSFTGDLEHLSIVDVIQLLHATRKSGTLTVRGRKGESQLVFNDGYIISANHFDNSVRIGNILVEAGVISKEVLEQALQEQEEAGAGRKPLVATLLERGSVRKEDAYRGLEALIELTVVEILTWRRGTFDLDVNRVSVSDEYRYFPEKLHEEITLHTENVLMDALRIYDEKKRDGLLVEEEFAIEAPIPDLSGDEAADFNISADDLGLGDLDQIERKIPQVFLGLEDRSPSLQRKIQELGADLSDKEQEELFAFLGRLGNTAPAAGAPTLSAILFSPDDLFSYCVTTVCRQAGISVFTTNDEQDLAPLAQQFASRGGQTTLILDSPASPGFTLPAEDAARLLRRVREHHPSLALIQLASPLEPAFALQALKDGAVAVFPRPVREVSGDTFLEDTLRLLDALPLYLRRRGSDGGEAAMAQLGKTLMELRALREPPEIALTLLSTVAGTFERALTLIVREEELIAERSIGIRSPRGACVSPSFGTRIPLDRPSVLRDAIEKRAAFYGETDDEILKGHLFPIIGAPLHPTVILLPLVCGGKVIALIYGDFGHKGAAPVRTELLELVTGEAGLVLETALYRRKRERKAPEGTACDR
ncbi:DUF4388 domain-containing protein [Geobacter sulfurreducens]|uniref:PatA-like N-terminal domain-containing protein n=1 Tax=Geobacter sulfurreducens (strain ATCC 51573 / DSM 12127 / PCA) TaxID=243231 RepID=Q74GL5_GEOSL|nr:response regulator [Geobacter sulfurreducens]AAR33565.1 hypothetical protein GSU0231 [Geobacter sulfurreducens PCA]ADI83069.1 hypothetical protein KN400_0206 [Geobacter sulfurreducens KN400]AJY69964.1 hypothetical protein RW64_10400 [Geobacter sulfurreducens]QVW35504.1 DUF4388 domain-containing protein [Geobacter sulfurreducens]UAC04327.1 response regulator [Geobacter sulfurreducens]